MRDVTIRKVMNGYTVQVGCQTLVFETREALLRELGRYLEAPGVVEQEYADKYGFAGGVAVGAGQAWDTPSSPYPDSTASTVQAGQLRENFARQATTGQQGRL